MWFTILGIFGFTLAELETMLDLDDKTPYVTSLPLHRQSVAKYHCKIRIEKDWFHMLLDTGSSSMWVASNFVDKHKWGNKTLLDKGRANSLRISHDHFYQAYASNDVNGLKATVDMQFGQMLVKNVPFGLVTHGSQQVFEDSFDGIFGLSRGPLHSLNTRTVLYFINQQDLVSQKFGFYFG
ncbi:hypothetical protein T265_16110, partial [Opisthorchis viverrini]